jgi:hypothetical protein
LLRWCLAQAPATGAITECGVYRGFSINLLAEWSARDVHGFDSLEGLPEDWKPDEPAGSYSTGGKIPPLRPNVNLHAGWFRDTLPVFADSCEESVALLHVDCDLYSSTATVLDAFGGLLEEGSIIVFDDFLSYPGYRDHEFRAAGEFIEGSSRSFELIAAVLLGRSVAFKVA